MRLILLFFTVLTISISFSSVSYAQDQEEDNKSTLGSLFKQWNDRQKEQLKAAAGIIDKEEEEEVIEQYKPKFKLEKGTSLYKGLNYADRRIAYLNDYLSYEDQLSGERNLHLQASLERDAEYLGQRKDHLQSALSYNDFLTSQREEHQKRMDDVQGNPFSHW